MPNGEEINERLEFQERIKKLPVEDRTTETALMVYDLSQKIDVVIDSKISKKVGAVSGGITAAITSIIIGVIHYFITRR